jgi:hypothetical protein
MHTDDGESAVEESHTETPHGRFWHLMVSTAPTNVKSSGPGGRQTFNVWSSASRFTKLESKEYDRNHPRKSRYRFGIYKPDLMDREGRTYPSIPIHRGVPTPSTGHIDEVTIRR